MNYRRVFRYTFLNDCDYNDLCKAYRQYVREQGHLRTLKEKAVQNPSIHDLVGTCFVHTGIKTVVQPESGFFDPQNPEKNNRVVPFSVRAQQLWERKMSMIFPLETRPYQHRTASMRPFVT